ncbi:MAG: serine/threonine protein kinase, partial [Planctomycetales bacterium]|nr:serine/threonine protein kinase [Planctomycetales bacterium]
LAQAAVHPLSRYELIAELGSGGMGVVYRAKHAQLGRETALKVLRGDRDNLEDRLRFDREAKLAASLSNSHTVTIYDYGRGDEGEAYCVMEFLKGITLYDVVARSGFQSYGRVMFILRQVCDSLGEAHKLGLVHRDIKPQNVMLSLDASVGDWAVVFDFGLAKPLQPDGNSYQTAETIWAGTPMYMAPERYREPNKIDPRSDIYSVGCIAYFLLSGRPPFIECDPESLFALVLTEQPISIGVHRDDEVPEEITAMVRRCMAKNIDDRYATIDQLAMELDHLIYSYPWSVDEARSWWRIHGDDLG